MVRAISSTTLWARAATVHNTIKLPVVAQILQYSTKRRGEAFDAKACQASCGTGGKAVAVRRTNPYILPFAAIVQAPCRTKCDATTQAPRQCQGLCRVQDPKSTSMN